MDARAIEPYSKEDFDRASTQFKKGNIANPKGRPKGARNKLGEAFIADLYTAWEQQGTAVIQAVIDKRPQDFLKIIANILPKDVHLKVSSTEDMTDEQLMRKLAALTEMAKPLLARIEPNAIDAEFVDISKA